MKHTSNSASWTRSKALGDRAEARVAALIHAHFGWAVGPSPTQVQGDLEATRPDGSRLLIEVKHDITSARTGNLAIEVARKIGKGAVASGVNFSASHLWAFALTKRCLFVPTVNLRALLASRPYGLRWVGDGQRSQCALVPIPHVDALPDALSVPWDALPIGGAA